MSRTCRTPELSFVGSWFHAPARKRPSCIIPAEHFVTRGEKSFHGVIPAEAGIQSYRELLGPRFRGDDSSKQAAKAQKVPGSPLPRGRQTIIR